MNKEEILEKYIELTKKLGKFPSKQNCIKFLCSYERIVKNYNSLTDLKEKAIKECPDLEKLVVPVKLTPKDIEDFRFNVKGEITSFGLLTKPLEKIIETGNPFRTSGCPDCNRPYYNEKPSGPIYNYPYNITKEGIEKIKKQL